MLADHGDGDAPFRECGGAGEADEATADDNDLGAQLICLF
jgi:hypothetical protein